MTIKVRVNDTVAIDKFAILKPEVEMQYPDGVNINDAAQVTLNNLAEVVSTQLNQIVGRMDAADCRRVINTAGLDPRFIEKVKVRLNSLS